MTNEAYSKEDMEELLEDMKAGDSSIVAIRLVELAIEVDDIRIDPEDALDIETCASDLYQSVTSRDFVIAHVNGSIENVRVAIYAPIIIAYKLGVMRGQRRAQEDK